MKKTLGLLAVIAGAAAVVAYKVKKDSEKKDIKSIEGDDIDGETILRNVEAQGFEPIDFDKKPESFSAKAFPHLNEEELIRISKINSDVFAELEEITANEERPIQHSVKFEKEIDLEEFKSIVIGEGYVVTTGEADNELLVLHISKMDQDDISAKVFYLADLAMSHSGVYEGWICK